MQKKVTPGVRESFHNWAKKKAAEAAPFLISSLIVLTTLTRLAIVKQVKVVKTY